MKFNEGQEQAPIVCPQLRIKFSFIKSYKRNNEIVIQCVSNLLMNWPINMWLFLLVVSYDATILHARITLTKLLISLTICILFLYTMVLSVISLQITLYIYIN